MSKEKRRVPKLRFPGFTEDWEQRKLSDVLVERNEQQVETSEYPLMSFVQGLGVVPKSERYDRSFLVLDQSKKYKRTELGDFIYSSNNLETGSIGINKTGKAVISPVYSIFQGVSIGDSQFIGIMSLLPRFIAKMIRFRQGVVYGQWRIHETDFLDISVLIPSVDERTKITQLILSIEEIVTLHQRKLDNLKLKKKALLQKLFPKNGERYPELRFPGFTDAWEQRKLGDLLILLKDGSHGTHKNTDAGVYLLSAKNIKNGRINIMPDDRIISWDDYNVIHKNYELQIGDILLTIVGSIGETAIFNLKTKVTFQRSVAFLRPNSNLNNGFLYTLINTDRFQNQLQTKQVVSAQPGIYLGDLATIDITYPKNILEQEKIYNIFREIENSITLHQRKLDHLQLQKKALLQQMFV